MLVPSDSLPVDCFITSGDEIASTVAAAVGSSEIKKFRELLLLFGMLCTPG